MDDGRSLVQRPTKGKVARRLVWADMPEDVFKEILYYIRVIVDREERTSLWRGRSYPWQQAKWTFLITANQLRLIRGTCKRWRDMTDAHPIWELCFGFFDPDRLYEPPASTTHGGSAVSATAPGRQFQDFARFMGQTCLPCAFNSPMRSNLSATRTMSTRCLSTVGLCKAPIHNPENVCGCCLKDVQTDAYREVDTHAYFDYHQRSIFAADDQETFAGTVATCKSCRSLFLAQRIRQYIGWRSAQWPPWILSIAEAYLDSGDGYLKDIMADIEQRAWFALYTNYDELHESALACERMRMKQELKAEREAEAAANGRTSMTEATLQELLDGGASPDAINRALAQQDEEDEEDEEMLDEEFEPGLSSAEEANVFDMALSGWVRNRILDGCWLSPMDIYHGPKLHRTVWERLRPAWHPVNSYLNSSELLTLPDDSEGRIAPRPSLRSVMCTAPPPRAFYRAQVLFEASMRQILLPAMENLVQRLIYECEMSGRDVCKEVAMMRPGDVLRELQQIQLWGIDYNWEDMHTSGGGGYNNDSSNVDQATTSPTIASTDGSLSSDERDRDSPPTSNTSATTQCTTPPMSPPSRTKKANGGGQMLPPPSPPPLPTRYLSHIPCIPQAQEHIGLSCWDTVTSIWREACSGLFKCQCRICERASGKAAAKEAAKQNQNQIQQQQQKEQQTQKPQAGIDVESETEEEEEEEGEVEILVPMPPPALVQAQPPRLVLSQPIPALKVPTLSQAPVRRSRSSSEGPLEQQTDRESPESMSRSGSPPSSPSIIGKMARRRSREEAEAEDDMATASSPDDEAQRDRKKVRLTPP